MIKPAYSKLLPGLALLHIVLNGCMAMGLSGMEHHSAHEEQPIGRTVIRQLHTERVEIDLEIPPLLAEKSATISVSLSAPQGGEGLSGAVVVFTIQRIDQPLPESEKGQEEGGIERRAEEDTLPGIYHLNHRFEKEGVYKITARIWINGNGEAVSPLVIEEIQKVVQPEKMRGRMNMVSMGLAGGAVMALMMVIGMGGYFF